MGVDSTGAGMNIQKRQSLEMRSGACRVHTTQANKKNNNKKASKETLGGGRTRALSTSGGPDFFFEKACPVSPNFCEGKHFVGVREPSHNVGAACCSTSWSLRGGQRPIRQWKCWKARYRPPP